MANKTKCHICRKKSTTEPCEFCGAILTPPVPETPVLFNNGSLIEGKMKTLEATFILTDQRIICTDVRSQSGYYGGGLLGAAIGAAVQEASKSKNADKGFSVPLGSIEVIKKHKGFLKRGYTLVTKDGFFWKVDFLGFGARKKWEAALSQFIQETDEKL